MAGGLELALNNLFESSAGDRPDSADVIVLITDGQGNRREDEELPFAEAAKSRNISIITVGITHKVNRDRLTEMATDGAFVMIDNFDVLQTMTQTILDFACKPLEIETTTVEPELTTEVPTTTGMCSNASVKTSIFQTYDIRKMIVLVNKLKRSFSIAQEVLACRNELIQKLHS